MKTEHWWSGLRARVLLLLSLALIPIGMIAVYQTSLVDKAAGLAAQRSLLALTQQAAVEERVLIERALGAGAALAGIAPRFFQDTGRCNATLRDFIQANDQFSFAAILPVSGLMTCSSNGATFDFSDYDNFATAVADGLPTVEVNISAPFSKTSVIIVSQPIHANDTLLGFVSLSIPHAAIHKTTNIPEGQDLRELITFNDSGDIQNGDHHRHPGGPHRFQPRRLGLSGSRIFFRYKSTRSDQILYCCAYHRQPNPYIRRVGGPHTF